MSESAQAAPLRSTPRVAAAVVVDVVVVDVVLVLVAHAPATNKNATRVFGIRFTAGPG
jgi:hypothetical protein